MDADVGLGRDLHLGVSGDVCVGRQGPALGEHTREGLRLQHGARQEGRATAALTVPAQGRQTREDVSGEAVLAD